MSLTLFRSILILLVITASCNPNEGKTNDTVIFYDTAVTDNILTDSVSSVTPTPQAVTVSGTDRDRIVDFALTLLGTPYKYASTNPEVGFDCSGFITYVFNHFNIKVPRSSVDFTNVGKEVRLADAKRGDLILFTGTDSTIRIVGHMGIVTSNTDTLKFIHASSGKVYGVTETPLNKYYSGRFVKVIDIF